MLLVVADVLESSLFIKSTFKALVKGHSKRRKVISSLLYL